VLLANAYFQVKWRRGEGEGGTEGDKVVGQGKEGRWTEELFKVLEETPEDKIEQRDLFDRPPSVLKSWASGNTVMIGDAVHPMMPNLGQGGCQAIEDAYVLARRLSKVSDRRDIGLTLQVPTLAPLPPNPLPWLETAARRQRRGASDVLQATKYRSAGDEATGDRAVRLPAAPLRRLRDPPVESEIRGGGVIRISTWSGCRGRRRARGCHASRRTSSCRPLTPPSRCHSSRSPLLLPTLAPNSSPVEGGGCAVAAARCWRLRAPSLPCQESATNSRGPNCCMPAAAPRWCLT